VLVSFSFLDRHPNFSILFLKIAHYSNDHRCLSSEGAEESSPGREPISANLNPRTQLDLDVDLDVDVDLDHSDLIACTFLKHPDN
jgi:hypothetical protein